MNLHPDLFGAPTPIRDPAPPGRSYTGGYAARPGTGPAGQTCKGCESYTLVRHHDNTFGKCDLAQWTHGKGTDIKAGSPACAKFEPATQKICPTCRGERWVAPIASGDSCFRAAQFRNPAPCPRCDGAGTIPILQKAKP